LLIGAQYGPVSLGLYSRAAGLLMRPLEQFMFPIEAVVLPALSRLQSDAERYRRTFISIYEAIALLTFYFGGLFLAISRPLTLVVLGPKWEKAAVIFSAFTISSLFYPLSAASTWLFSSQGRGRDSLLASTTVSVAAIFSFLAGLPFGPAGVAIVFSVTGVVVLLPIMFWIAGSSGPVTRVDLWKGFFHHVPVWAIVCTGTYVAYSLSTDYTPWTQLMVCVPVGSLTGAIFICLYTPSRRVALVTINALRSWRASRRHSAQ
jgi:PST family polysaccharide transporter